MIELHSFIPSKKKKKSTHFLREYSNAQDRNRLCLHRVRRDRHELKNIEDEYSLVMRGSLKGN